MIKDCMLIIVDSSLHYQWICIHNGFTFVSKWHKWSKEMLAQGGRRNKMKWCILSSEGKPGSCLPPVYLKMFPLLIPRKLNNISKIRKRHSFMQKFVIRRNVAACVTKFRHMINVFKTTHKLNRSEWFSTHA